MNVLLSLVRDFLKMLHDVSVQGMYASRCLFKFVFTGLARKENVLVGYITEILLMILLHGLNVMINGGLVLISNLSNMIKR